MVSKQLCRSTNTADDARLDIKAGEFWSANRHECAYFDVRVLYPHAHSYRNHTLEQLDRSHEQDKRRDYIGRVRNVETNKFTPLVFSTTGGTAPTATTFLLRLADKVAEKRNSSYAQTLGCLRCRLSFALLSGVKVTSGFRALTHITFPAPFCGQNRLLFLSF